MNNMKSNQQNTSTTHNSQLKGLKRMRRKFSLINQSIESMRREVLTPLSNEKVKYIEFQDDLWVTFDPWLFIFQGGF